VIDLLNLNAVPINHWVDIAVSNFKTHLLKLLYHRKGNYTAFEHVLKTALKDEDVAIDGSNSYLFDDKKGRYTAMNALASNYFQLFEE